MQSIVSLWFNTRRKIAFIKLSPFDISTSEGRANERHRRIALTAIAAAAAKGIAVLTTMVSIPLTVNYLGVERYGMWATISSFVALLSFADFGMGNGLMNAVSEANGKDDNELAHRYVSSGFFLLTGVAFALTALFLRVYPFVPWQHVFNVSSAEAVAESGPAIAVFVVCFLINIPLGVVQRVQMGYQEGFANSLWIASGNLLGLMGVLLVIYLRAGLPWLVLAMVGSPALASLLNGIVLFGFRRPWLRPKLKVVTGDASLKIFRLGLLFFILQLAVAMAYTSDNIVIAQILGSEAVTQYAIPYRLFTIAPMILGMVLTPLWPAYGEAFSRQDVVWIRSTLYRSLKTSLLVVGVPSCVLVVLGKYILHLWVGTEITASLFLLLGLGVWSILSALGNATAMFLNGISVINFQVLTALFLAVGALVSKLIFIQTIGLPGVIWATIISYVVFVLIPLVIFVPRILVKIETKE